MGCSNFIILMKTNFKKKSTLWVLLLLVSLSSLCCAKIKREYNKIDDATLIGVEVPFVKKNDGILGLKDFELKVSYGMAFWVDGNHSKGDVDQGKIPKTFSFAISKELDQIRGYSEEAHTQRWEGADTIVVVYRPFGSSKDGKPKGIDIKANYKHFLGKDGEGSYSTEMVVGDVPMEDAVEISRSTDVTVAVSNSDYRFGEFDIRQKDMKGMQELCGLLTPHDK